MSSCQIVHQVVVEEHVVDVHPQVGGDDAHNSPVLPLRGVRLLVEAETKRKHNLNILGFQKFYIVTLKCNERSIISNIRLWL